MRGDGGFAEAGEGNNRDARGVLTGLEAAGSSMPTRRIGILTGGGDVPGLNVAIKAVVIRAKEVDIEVVGLRRGWMSVLNMNPDDPASADNWTMPLTPDRAHDRPHRRHVPAHLAHQPQQRQGRRTCPTSSAPRIARPVATGRSTAPSTCCACSSARARRAHPDRRRRHAQLRQPGCTRKASASSPSRRRWTTTSSAPITASASPPPSRARWRPSPPSAPRSARTSASAWWSCSAATPARPRSFAAYLADVDRAVISEVPFDMERLADFLVEDREAQPVQLRDRDHLGRRAPGRRRDRAAGEADAYGHQKLGGIGHYIAEEIKRAHRREHHVPAARPTSCAPARRTRSTAWWPSRSATWRSTRCRWGTRAGWWRCSRASTRPSRWTW